MLLISIFPANNLKSELTHGNSSNFFGEEESITQPLKDSNGDPYDFQGTEPSLDITDYGNLYKYDQQISLLFSVRPSSINLQLHG